MKRCEIRLQKCGINTDKNKNSVKTSDLAIQCSQMAALYGKVAGYRLMLRPCSVHETIRQGSGVE